MKSWTATMLGSASHLPMLTTWMAMAMLVRSAVYLFINLRSKYVNNIYETLITIEFA